MDGIGGSKNKYYDEDCSPRICFKCGSEEFKTKNTDWVDFTVVEYNIYCKECGELLGIWAYGSYDPCFAWSVGENHPPTTSEDLDEFDDFL